MDFRFTTPVKLYVVLSLLCFFVIPQKAAAQFPYFQSFKDTTAPGLVIAGAARLTAKTVDAQGTGYLRLTDTLINQVGCVYAEDSFPSQNGIVASFEFFTYNRTGSTPADGFSFFLFDASISAFRAGPTGGSLGYAQKFGTPGLGKGYIGIGVDEFGNFSVISDGNKSGGTASKVKPAVVIRGPGNGATSTDYPYITGVQTDLNPHNTPFNSFAQRYSDSSLANYRRLKIIMKPGSSLGTAGYKVTVVMYKGAGAINTPVVSDTLINNYDYPYIAPAKLQYGLIASTGSVFAFHEIRNMQLEAYNAASLSAPTLNNDTVTVCSGNQRLIDITANDLSNNTSGVINKASIDLDPNTAGIQTSFTDAGKGSYSVDAAGIVTFTQIGSYTGTSVISYKAADNYGAAATSAGSIVVNITSGSALSLNVTDPAGVCGSGTVNITSAAVTAGSTSGTSFSYYNTLTDALNGTSNINSTASAISVAGTYYIRGDLSGCYTAKPVNVVISATPSTAVAGGNQNMCISSSLLTTLQATAPTIGTGAWSQLSGPGTANIAIPMSSYTQVQFPATAGSYVLRWSVTNGVCAASNSDLTVTVYALPTTANAGGNHTLCNASSYTLSGNTPTLGTGAWTVPYNTSGVTPTLGGSSNPTSGVTNISPGNTYAFQWRITNGSCSSTSIDTLRILQPPTTATSNGNQNLTGATTATVQGNTPTSGTGLWSQTAGPTVTITSPTSPTTTVTGLTGGNNYGLRWTISNGVCTPTYSDLTVANAMPLPLKILSFTGQWNGSAEMLFWETANERDCDYFDISRSADGVSFMPIGRVKAGNQAAGSSYQFADNEAGGLAGKLYYHLQEVDFDGSTFRANTVTLYRGSDESMQLWPNPFTDQLSIGLNVMAAGDAEITLTDVTGRVAYHAAGALHSGANQLLLKDLSPLPAGIYILSVRQGGGFLLRERLIK